MKIKNKNFVILFVIILGLFLILVISFKTNKTEENKFEKNYIGLVNDTKILKCEFDYFINIEKSKILNETLTKEKEIDNKSVDDIVKERALEQVIKFKVLYLKAVQEGFELNRNELNGIQDNLKSVKKRGDDVVRSQFYKVYGLESEEEYLFVKKEEELIKKFTKHIYEGFGKTSEEDMLSYYNKNINQFSNGEVESIKVIYFKEDEKKIAEQVLDKIKRGDANFEEMITMYSSDNETKRQSGEVSIKEKSIYYGLLNYFNTNNLKAGDITDVIDAEFINEWIENGYYIAKRNGIKEVEYIPYKDAKSSIQKHINDEKVKQQIEMWRKEVTIELDNEVIKNHSIIDVGRIIR